MKRETRCSTAAVLWFALGWLAFTVSVVDGATTWSPAAPMNAPRLGHTVTLMPDGRALVVGGPGDVYSPATGAWAPASPATMNAGRSGHAAAVLLPQPSPSGGGFALPLGGVLVAGGVSGSPAASVEIYDTAADTWRLAAPMATSRSRHTATLLADDRVLVAGGRTIDPITLDQVLTSSAEIYDPDANAWTQLAPLPEARAFHSATLLVDGRVLVVGGDSPAGIGSTAAVFDPVTGVWASVPMLEARKRHTATLLPDGRVLIAGGQGPGGFLATAELFDPATDTFAPAATLPEPRVDHAAEALGDGTPGPGPRVVVSGGFVVSGSGSAFVATALVYEPDAGLGTWVAVAPMNEVRSAHAAVLLADGRVLVVGGRDTTGLALDTAELFAITSNRPPVAGAGAPQTVVAGPSCLAPVTLDGSASTDPDGDPFTLSWAGIFGTVSGPGPTVSLPLGRHTITLTVTDAGAASATSTVDVVVLDGAPPILTPPPPIVVREGEPVNVPLATATDCGPGVVVTSDAPATFPLGTTIVTFTARDAANNVATASTMVTVIPSTPVTDGPGRMSGHGWVEGSPGARSYFAFVAEVTSDGRSKGELFLLVKSGWGASQFHTHSGFHGIRHDYFRGSAVSDVTFSDDPALVPGGNVTVDTVAFLGTGAWNSVPGYTFEVRAADGGDPWKGRDRFAVIVRAPGSGIPVATGDGAVRDGDVQSHEVRGPVSQSKVRPRYSPPKRSPKASR